MGVTPPTLTAPVTTASVSGGITTPAVAGTVTGAPTYKMEPGDPGLYYPGPGLPETDPHTGPGGGAGFHPTHPGLGVPGAGPELGSADFMQTLQTYMGQPGTVDMQHHEGNQILIQPALLECTLSCFRRKQLAGGAWQSASRFPPSGV